MKITHVTKRQNDGRHIPLTLVSENSAFGQPRASSFHGWLHEHEIAQLLKQYRDADNRQEKFNG